MTRNVFVCFDNNDPRQVEAFNALKERSKQVLETHALAFKEITPDGTEKLVKCQINDNHSKVIREEVVKKLDECAKLVVLIGNETYKNPWVEWEINNFYKIKESLSPGKAWLKIRGMSLEGCEKAAAPKALECKSTKRLSWEPETLEKWFEE